MQNKPIYWDTKMSLNFYPIKCYNNKYLFAEVKNKANRSQYTTIIQAEKRIYQRINKKLHSITNCFTITRKFGILEGVISTPVPGIFLLIYIFSLLGVTSHEQNL